MEVRSCIERPLDDTFTESEWTEFFALAEAEYRLVVVGDVDMRGQEEIEIAFVSPIEANLLRLLGVF